MPTAPASTAHGTLVYPAFQTTHPAGFLTPIDYYLLLGESPANASPDTRTIFVYLSSEIKARKRVTFKKSPA